MADLPEPAADDATDAVEAAEAPSSPRRGLRSLDGRTVAICLVLGIGAALLTVLLVSVLTSDDDPASSAMQLVDSTEDRGDLLTTPLATLDGGETDLAAFQEDQPMLVNLWQSTCLPCVEEMPMLDEAQADNPGITFVGVATLEDAAKSEKLAEQTGITYPWASDPTGEVYYAAEGAGMPTTLLLDADGAVISRKTGPFDDAAELQTFLDQAG